MNARFAAGRGSDMRKEVGSFTMKTTSITMWTEAGGMHCFRINLEGTASGAFDGALLSTLTVRSQDLANGTFESDSALYRKDGSVLAGHGQGVSVSLGGHRWQLSSHDLLGDGSTIAIESEADLANRSWVGKVFR